MEILIPITFAITLAIDANIMEKPAKSSISAKTF